MLWQKRESDGEPVLTGFGCLVILALLPLAPLFYLVWRLDRFFSVSEKINLRAETAKYEGRENTLKQRQHRYFFRKTGLSPQVFWLAETTYELRSIPKATGGTRQLAIPNDELKDIQKNIAEFIGREHPRCEHKTANGFVRGRSTVTNAVPHLGCKVLIKLDVKDFFDSVDCSRLKISVLKAVNGNGALADRIMTLCTYNDALPQGAPSSPLLSNFYMWNFDKEMYGVCSQIDAKYTRYADDITLSLPTDNRNAIYYLIRSVEEKLAKIGLRLNKKAQKLQILRRHQAQRICGITINSGTTTISRKKRRMLRAAKHRKSQGLDSTLTENQIKGWDSYINGVNIEAEKHSRKRN